MMNNLKDSIVERSLAMVALWKSILEEDDTVEKYRVIGDTDWGEEKYTIEVTYKG